MSDSPEKITNEQAQRQRTEYTLLGTDDAMIWAEEFCRIFSGKIIATDNFNAGVNSPVDPGTMVGWFANAMATAVSLYEERKRQATEEQKEAFIEGFQEGRPE